MAKHRDFECEVTVYIWRFLSPDHPGHAAVKVRGLTGVDDAYITWWPHRPATPDRKVYPASRVVRTVKSDMRAEIGAHAQRQLGLGNFAPRADQVPIGMEWTEGVQVTAYGKLADHKIKLPGLGAAGVTFGLDTARMAAWWRVFRACPHPRFRLASKTTNCSGVAAAALRAGGADQFVKAPAAAFYLDPNQIAKWARDLRTKLDKKNGVASRLAVVLQGAGDPVPLEVDEIMSVAAWMQFSNKDMRGAVARSDKVKAIDRLLQQFHALPPIEGCSYLDTNRKMDILGELMDAIHYYLNHKADSKRSDAVLTLGRQVLGFAKKQAEARPTLNRDWIS